MESTTREKKIEYLEAVESILDDFIDELEGFESLYKDEISDAVLDETHQLTMEMVAKLKAL